ncbi:MAG: pentapeptide repeat-containing protein [Flavobacteriales bacterium]|nr:pentapeptide repeat-containing protein [Flavobacteriales bacterium]
MSENTAENQEFNNVNFSEAPIKIKEFDCCTFTNCSFASTDLSGIQFIECEFTNCNLSMAILNNTSFKDIRFSSCKILGVNFTDCNPFLLDFNFADCLLNLSSFYQLKLKGITFSSCQLQEVDFTECDLTNARFYHSDLGRAIFENTIIEKADFRTAMSYSINPEINYIRKARFSTDGISGLLDNYDIDIE